MEKPDKQDLGKPRWSLLPWQQVEDVLQVLMFGAKKYCDDGWQTIKDGRKRYLEAAQRHLAAYFKGERQDKESGLLTLAHAVCSLLFVMWYDRKEEK